VYDQFNDKITLRVLLGMTYHDKEYSTRFFNAERDCKVFAKDLIIKEVSSYSRYNVPIKTYEVISKSYPNYPPYTKKLGETQNKIQHSYPVMMSFFLPKGSPQRVSLNSPVKIRTGRGGKVPTRTKRLDKLIKSKDNPNGKYISWSDYVAQEYEINLDFYYRNSLLRSTRKCLFGKNYATKEISKNKPKKKSNRDEAVKKRQRRKLFLTKHEIAVITHLLNIGFFGKDKTIYTPY